MVNHLQVATTAARSFGLIGRDVTFQQYWHAISEVERNTDDLAALVADNPAQAAAAQQLRSAITARHQQFEQILSDYRTRGDRTTDRALSLDTLPPVTV